MKVLRKIFIYFTMVFFILPFFSLEGQKTFAASTCAGVSPLTDPLAIKMENGQMLIWENVNPNLLAAKAKYEQLLKVKGWRITYYSAYRPYQYQKHFYEIVHAPASACRNAEISKHGLTGVVAAPNANAPHTKGIAFDAIVYNQSGVALNGSKFVSSSLVAVAKQAGLLFTVPTSDGVHHELASQPPVPVPIPVDTPMSAKGKVTGTSGFNVRTSPTASAARIGGVYKNDIVDIVAKSGDWYKIKFGSGYGYIMAASSGLELLAPPVPTETPMTASGKITAEAGFNVRSLPNASATRIGGVYKNNVVDIVAKSGDWYKIKFGSGYGYIMAVQSGLDLINPPTIITTVPSISMATNIDVNQSITASWNSINGASHYVVALLDQTTGLKPINNLNVYQTSYTVNSSMLTPGHSYKFWVGVSNDAGTNAGNAVYFKVNQPAQGKLTLIASLTNLYNTASFADPSRYANGSVAALAPQTVSVISQQDDWYQISTSLGNRWVNIKEPTRVDLILTVPLTNLYNTASYTDPSRYANGTVAALAPQTVKVISQQGDWYQISTSLGNRWVNIKEPTRVDLILTAPLTNLYNTALFTDPSRYANGTIAALAPQTVKVISEQGDWYQISTYLGNRWVNIKEPTRVDTTEVTFNTTGKITAPSGFNVRSKPDVTASRIGGVYLNDTVQIVAKSGDWYKINFGSGFGYIMAVNSGLTFINQPSSETAYNATAQIITPSGLNVRKSASETSSRIGGVYYNNVVTIVAKAGDFYKIKFGNGFGYIANHSSYLTIQGNNSNPSTNPNSKLTENDLFAEALAFTLGVEGGYVYDRNDYGGPTNMGVTQSTFNTYRDQKRLPRKDVRNITFNEARDVYYTLYWKTAKCDRMDRTLAIVMFDTAVNLGVNGNSVAGGAIKHLQKAMNISADGSWGPTTETVFSNYSKSQHYALALKVVGYNKDFRYVRVKQDPSQQRYLEGWLNRDNKLLTYIQKIGK